MLPLLLLLTLSLHAHITGNAGHDQFETVTIYSRAYVDSLNEKAFKRASTEPNEATRLSNKALRIAHKLSYDDGRVNALNTLAIINRNIGNYSASLNFSRQALRIAYTSDKAPLIGRSYYHLGDLHKILGNFDKALSYFKQSFYLFNRSREYLMAIKSLSNYAHTTMDLSCFSGDFKCDMNVVSFCQ